MENHRIGVSGPSWGVWGPCLGVSGASWGVSGASVGVSEASWGVSGASWEVLGPLRRLGASLRRLGTSLERLGVCFDRSGGPFWLPLPAFEHHFGVILAAWNSHLDPPGEGFRKNPNFSGIFLDFRLHFTSILTPKFIKNRISVSMQIS